MTQMETVFDDQPVVDNRVIERLRRDMAEETDPIIESYVESIFEFIEQFDNRGDLAPEDDLHRWAHTIKSAAKGIGAMRVAHLAEEIESAYRDRIRIDLDSYLASLKIELDRALQRLQDILSH